LVLTYSHRVSDIGQNLDVALPRPRPAGGVVGYVAELQQLDVAAPAPTVATVTQPVPRTSSPGAPQQAAQAGAGLPVAGSGLTDFALSDDLPDHTLAGPAPDPAAEPVATEPVTTEPVATESVAAEPVATESVAAEPVAAEPAADVTTAALDAPASASGPAGAEPVTVTPAEDDTVEILGLFAFLDADNSVSCAPLPYVPRSSAGSDATRAFGTTGSFGATEGSGVTVASGATEPSGETESSGATAATGRGLKVGRRRLRVAVLTCAALALLGAAGIGYAALNQDSPRSGGALQPGIQVPTQPPEPDTSFTTGAVPGIDPAQLAPPTTGPGTDEASDPIAPVADPTSTDPSPTDSPPTGQTPGDAGGGGGAQNPSAPDDPMIWPPHPTTPPTPQPTWAPNPPVPTVPQVPAPQESPESPAPTRPGNGNPTKKPHPHKDSMQTASSPPISPSLTSPPTSQLPTSAAAVPEPVGSAPELPMTPELPIAPAPELTVEPAPELIVEPDWGLDPGGGGLTATLSRAVGPAGPGGRGYVARILNPGPSAVAGWRLTMALPAGVTVRAEERVTVTPRSGAVTFAPTGSSALAGGDAVTFSFELTRAAIVLE
jgi:hypothetical protein